MNIDSANFLPLLSEHLATEGVSPPLTGYEIPASFAGTFMEQLKLLSSENNQSELLKPIQTHTNSSNLSELQSLADLLGEGGDMKKIAAFFGKELPVSYKLTGDADPEATLSALTDILKFANSNEIQGVGTDGKNNTEATAISTDTTLAAAADIKVIQADNPPDAAEIRDVIDGQSILLMNEPPATNAASFVADKKDADSKNNQITKDNEHTGELAEAILTLVIAPVMASAVEQNSSPGNSADLAVVKQQLSIPLMKNSAQNNGSASIIADSSDEASDNFLQKQASEPRSEPSKPAFNLNYFEKTEDTDKNAQIERGFTLSGEKNLSRGVADISQLIRHTADIRAEVPALTKHITHPGWSKDLGEKILWMNNRSIPAAEIKLNPQHLGPISVRVDINQDQASISFVAQHGTVRDALEASIPKLRDMMTAQQLNLIDVNVSQHFSSDQGRSQQHNFAQTAVSSGQDVADMPAEAMDEIDNGQAVMTKGLLSIYA